VKIATILDRLEKHYGEQKPSWPVDPYKFIVWWHCGYPASDRTCEKGWQHLNAEVGTAPDEILHATPKRLAAVLKTGGLIPELRTERLREIAVRVKTEFGGDLRRELVEAGANAKNILKSFPGIAEPGSERILLFSGLEAVAAVPSNGTQVLVRIVQGTEQESYAKAYLTSQEAITAEVPRTDARQRAYLLVKVHGQETCKRTKPKCEQCPVNADCAYFARSKWRESHP
jgi:endonuclease-3